MFIESILKSKKLIFIVIILGSFFFISFMFCKNNYKMMIENTKTGITLKLDMTWKEVLDSMAKGICPFNFPDFQMMWKCKPFTSLNEQFVCKFVKSEFKKPVDLNTFDKYFKNSNEQVVSFLNKSGSTILIAPKPEKDTNFAHLHSFLKTASSKRKQELWKKIAKVVYYNYNSKQSKIFLSTHGHGVSYLHIRIKNSNDYGYPMKF